MSLLKKRSMRFYLAFFLVLAMTLSGSAIVAFADSGTGATVAVNHGNLTETGPSTISATPVTLNGDDQTTTYALGLTITDARGSGAGWNLTITSTTFTGINPANLLSTTASNINTAPTVACIGIGNHCTSPNPDGTVTYPVGVPAAASAPTPVKFFNSASASGLGKFTITPTVTIAIPANTYADTYSSTVSVAVVSGP